MRAQLRDATALISGFLLVGCALSGLSDSELAEFRRLDQQVIAMCKAAEPDEVPAKQLRPRLERLLELARQDPDRRYDPDPTNDPSTSDEAFPAVDLIYLSGLLIGREGPPACNKREGERLEVESGKLD